MKKLSKRERVIMDIFWKNGPLTTSEVRELMPEPRPHINTISTQVRMLEGSGFLSHRKEGTGYRYFSAIEWQDYSNEYEANPLTRCMQNSYIKAVSALVKDDKISVDELRELIELIDSDEK
ncbi:MAG: BlaI/MecI/CopY family transcriptional regulator [Bacteroidaceae bacterium]|nr:BlaI/MecI/CopY family transcriptional regulator [Candidatus Colenecus caballi]MCQ2072873.1 BlaI/MecI/CopY family transcriptional regulator [Bacteroidaceae bacterium]